MPADGMDALLPGYKTAAVSDFHAATGPAGQVTAQHRKDDWGQFVTMAPNLRALSKGGPGHPAITSLPERWRLQDEWYLFRNLDKENMHVLALLEIGRERKMQEKYNIPDYPMIWCKAYGNGRILYNGMGHREDVWEHETFKALVKEHLLWVSGQGPLDAEPNYTEVVPETLP